MLASSVRREAGREGEEKGGRENFLQQLPFSLFFSWVSWVDGVRRRMCESQSELIWHGMGGATEGGGRMRELLHLLLPPLCLLPSSLRGRSQIDGR